MIINLITYNNSTNYGALLQCLCLKDLIEENFNCLVKLNRYHPSKLVYAEKYRPLVTRNFNKFLGTVRKNLNVYFWKKHAFKNHILTKKTTKQKRRLTNTGLVDKSDLKNVKQQLGMK